jgi:hypothetical protein
MITTKYKMAEYQVPRLLWESLEGVLLAQGRVFVRDVARRLAVDEKELLRQVMPKDKIHVYLHDTQTEDMQCHAFVQTESVIHHCRRPVTLGSEYCFLHFRDRLRVHEHDHDETRHVQQLEASADRPSLWKRTDGTVINSKGEIVGMYNKDTAVLTLYEID